VIDEIILLLIRIAKGQSIDSDKYKDFLKKLQSEGIVARTKDGWKLALPPEKIKLREIYEIVEKNEEKDVECDFKEVCDYDYHKKRIERRVKEILEDTTLRDLLFAEHLKNP